MTHQELFEAIAVVKDAADLFEQDVRLYWTFMGMMDDHDPEFENIRRPEFMQRMTRLAEWMSEHADGEAYSDFAYVRIRCNTLYDLADLMKHFEPPRDIATIFGQFIEKERIELVKEIDNLFREVHELNPKENDQ